ncbi:MAG: DUF4982 domain-containing protein [Kiritimatiellae bacterium]|nr:DUF4982 domain-containing protein [Kiritimatiellia bacterium]
MNNTAGALCVGAALSILAANQIFGAGQEKQFTTQKVDAKRLELPAWERQETDLDFGWRFAIGRQHKAETAHFNDRNWRIVDLPHDYQFEQPWEEAGTGARGFKMGGTEGWYRKKFDFDPAWEGKRIYLEFEAAMATAEVWVNEHKLADVDYGYLGATYDITDIISAEMPNLVAVRCNTGKGRKSRWYTGGGLIRPVRLIVKSQVNILEDGLYITTDGKSKVNVEVQLDNFRGLGRANELEVRAVVKDGEGREAATASTRAEWSKLRRQRVKLPVMEVKDAKLWDLDSPNLYTCEVTLNLNGRDIDNASDRFGFRTVEFGKDFGMKLNGRKVWLCGMANHHDLGAVGAAAYERSIRRMFATLKKFGYNTVRCSHNPYSKSFYRLADEMGLLVVDELYDKWGFGGNYWIGSDSQEKMWPYHIRRWMMRDRNHPSVICWSFGNELQMDETCAGYMTDDWGVTTYRVMKAYAQRWDDTRLFTVAMFPSRAGGVGKKDPADLYNTYTPPELATVTDIASFNYQPQAYADYLKCAPHMIVFQSEATTSELLRPLVLMDREKMAGLCYWGAIEYWGESNQWPKKGWNFSFFSHTLEPYPTAWLIMGGMHPETPVVHIGVMEGQGESINWNEVQTGKIEYSENWSRKPGKVVLFVFSNRDEVELFVNGKSLGRKTVSKALDETNGVVRYDGVEWEPGKVRAVAYEGGKAVCEHEIESAGKPVRLKIDIEPGEYKADGKDLVYARVTATDADGRTNLSATGKVSFKVEGAGSFLACDNGDHYTDELFTSDIKAKDFYRGSVQCVVRTARKPGKITIRATCDGLESAVAEVEIR